MEDRWPNHQTDRMEIFYWAMQDSNFNVLGIVDNQGVLRERLESVSEPDVPAMGRKWPACKDAGPRRIRRKILRGPRTRQAGHCRPTLRAACLSGPPGVAPPPQPGVPESTRRRFLAGAEMHAVADAPGSETDSRFTPYGERKVLFSRGANDGGLYAATGLSRRFFSFDWGIQPYGRFIQRDPLGYVDGMGLYEYVRSSPNRFPLFPPTTPTRQPIFGFCVVKK
jgi:hypothetical protein